MDTRNTQHNSWEGRLPPNAPLANPYVPFQREAPPRYELRKALVRGTMYPGLDLPFQGMINQKEQAVTPLTELQALGFAVQELALYLDTHSGDQEALELYRTYQQQYRTMAQEYAQKCGPLNHMMPTEQEGYQWLDDPWPWEFSQNKED